jgi:hypothetical protein
MITATSKNFGESSSCSIELTSVIVTNPATKEAFYTNFPHDIEWSYQKNTYT